MSFVDPLQSFRLDGKRALVTGSGRGIGLAIARSLAAIGAHVTLAARTQIEISEAAQALKEAGLKADAIVMDVTDVEQTAAIIAETGHYDILVNNAGTNRPGPLSEMTTDDFDAVMNVNVRAAYFTSQAVVNGLKQAGKGGSIINISSQMGHVGSSGRTIYCASKHAVEGMSKAMAVELGPDNIRVNTICPTFIETPLTEPYLKDEAFKSWVLSKIKLGRIGQVNDIVGGVIYLASDASSMVTGSALKIDGGWTAE